jgi:hypothetical protein
VYLSISDRILYMNRLRSTIVPGSGSDMSMGVAAAGAGVALAAVTGLGVGGLAVVIVIGAVMTALLQQTLP